MMSLEGHDHELGWLPRPRNTQRGEGKEMKRTSRRIDTWI